MKNGRRLVARMYRRKYRFDPRDKIKDVPLYTNDKQGAQQKLRKIAEEEQRERDGILSPKKQRDAASASLQTHIKDFIADRYAVGRDEKYVRELQKKLVRLVGDCGWKEIASNDRIVLRVAWGTAVISEGVERISKCDLWVDDWLEPRVGPNPLRSEGPRKRRDISTAKVIHGRRTAALDSCFRSAWCRLFDCS